MNKQSPVYTIIYIIVLVVIVGTALAITSMALKDKQKANANADKMRQILAAVHVTPAGGDVLSVFDKCITAQYVVNSEGDVVEGVKAFDVNVKDEVRLPDNERKLPVYEYTPENGKPVYILPVYGAGLWGPIWGYVAIDNDCSTVYGAYFSHEGETPGLGAEIEKPEFSDQFNSNLHMFKDGRFLPISVVKKGQKPVGDEDFVDGISGGTITSKGVGTMINNCITPYQKFLEKTALKNK